MFFDVVGKYLNNISLGRKELFDLWFIFLFYSDFIKGNYSWNLSRNLELGIELEVIEVY